jgi:hypothetical protein
VAVQVKEILPRHVAGEVALEATQCLSTREEVLHVVGQVASS